MPINISLLIRSVGKKNRQLRLGQHAIGHAAEDPNSLGCA
jgi:hypothetical protein